MKKKSNGIVRFFKGIFRVFDKFLITPITKFFIRITDFVKDNSKGAEKFLNNKQTLIVLSLIFALGVFYVVDQNSNAIINQSAEILYNQPVTAEYNEEAYVIEGLPETVDITLIGRSSDIYLAKQYPTNEVSVDLRDLKPGNAIGLAWTSMGGATLTIESIRVSEKKDSGTINVTGQLGDVMTESVQIAYSHVRSIAQNYGVNENYFNDAVIHLHIPEGATPKDGPSAGITMATALLSLAMNKVIRNDTAMTGELSLNGKVLPIGGLKEKTIAAKRLGFIKHIIIPYENIRDLDEIPDNVKKGLTFHPVKSVEEVFDFMFKLNKLNKKVKKEKSKKK